MSSPKTQLTSLKLPPLGQPDEIQVIPRGTILRYKGFSYELIEDVRAKGSASIARADATIEAMHQRIMLNNMIIAAESTMTPDQVKKVRDIEAQSHVE